MNVWISVSDPDPCGSVAFFQWNETDPALSKPAKNHKKNIAVQKLIREHYKNIGS